VICLTPVPFARMTNMSRLSGPLVKTIDCASGDNPGTGSNAASPLGASGAAKMTAPAGCALMIESV